MRTPTLLGLPLFLLACGGEAADSAVSDPLGPRCGEEVTMALGSGAGASFSAWTDGTSVSRSEQGGSAGLEVRGQATGLYTQEQGTLVLRALWDDGGSDDYIAGAVLDCVDDVVAVAGFAAFPDAWQADPAAHDGESVTLTLTLTDAAGTAAVGTQTVVIAP